ncbi:MAG: hypothetical protein Q8R00_04360 [Candidatus Nanoarchaeia archaeon]|nr:hypothetical protein [Candidatus Nanoarchaeia archaeon]
MEFLVPIVAFLGLFIGKLIGWMSSDEIKPGLPYFFAAKRFILFGIFALLIFDHKINFMLGLFLLLGLIIGGMYKLTYLFLGFSILLSLNQWQLLPVASLTFIYNLIYGTLEKSFIKEILLFFIPFILLIFNFNQEMLTAFISGALLMSIIFS